MKSKLDYFEKKFEYFFNKLPDPVLIVDESLEKIVNVNQEAVDFLGYSENELENVNFSKLIGTHEEYKKCKNFIKKNLDKKLKVFEQKFCKKDGKIIDAAISLKKLNSQYGANIIITCRDVTVEKHEEFQLKKMNKSLKKKIELKAKKLYKNEKILLEQSKFAQMGEMLNMIAHQWRQPINSISTAAMNLSIGVELGTLKNETIEEISQFIQDESQRVSQIINDFMEFNKSEVNREFFISKATNEVRKMVTSQLKNRSIVLETNVDKTLKVFHNKKNIEHVLLNLIMNARDEFENKKSLPNKTIKIYTEVNDKYISLNVEDNAGGIKDDIIDKVFNPYFTTKEQGKGTGIGLYMSKRMVESVKGSSLRAKSTGNSAIFSIYFALPA